MEPKWTGVHLWQDQLDSGKYGGFRLLILRRPWISLPLELCADYLGLEPTNIRNCKAFLRVCLVLGFEEVGSGFRGQNETWDSRCLILGNKTTLCLIFYCHFIHFFKDI